MSRFVAQSSSDQNTALIEHDESTVRDESMKGAYRDENAFEQASWWSRSFFSWTSPVLKNAKQHQIEVDQLGAVRKEHDVRAQQARLEAAWDIYKDSSNENKMLKAVFRAYRREYAIIMMWSFVIAAL